MNMKRQDDLRRTLERIDGRGYKAYRDIQGFYELGIYQLEIAHVQGDPYAPPSRIHVRVPISALGLTTAASGPPARSLALEDFLGRCLEDEIYRSSNRDIAIDRFGQEVLTRTAVRQISDQLEVRLFVHLPAAGRRIRARAASHIFLTALPKLLSQSLEAQFIDLGALRKHQDTTEDYFVLVDHLRQNSWTAFIANGSQLPRRAGHDDRPLEKSDSSPLVPFRSPDAFEREVDLPHAGLIRGLAIETGVTLLVGGGFHGKTTVLDAISRGIYPHIPGDGRELVASIQSTVKVRAEDGRAVTGTDISPFISDLPYGRSTLSFSTKNASGSTSQAANIIEAIEAGARVLLLDEDTSATNFMIRDEPMRRLLKPAQEPITPFLDRVGNLWSQRGVSSVLVVGGSGEYFRAADRVIQMDHYQPVDVTAKAKEIIGDWGGAKAQSDPFPPPGAIRRLRLDRYRRKIGPKGPRIKAVGTTRILAMKEEIDLGACEQLVSSSQTRTLCEILDSLLATRTGNQIWDRLRDGFTPEDLQAAIASLGNELLDSVSHFPRGDLAAVRDIEVMAMLNRLRLVQVERE